MQCRKDIAIHIRTAYQGLTKVAIRPLTTITWPDYASRDLMRLIQANLPLLKLSKPPYSRRSNSMNFRKQ